MKTEKPAKPSAQASRRRFAKAAATALVVAPLAAARSSSKTSAQTPSTREATAPPNPKPSPSPTPPAPQKPSPLVEAYTEAARVRFGDKLSPEELERVHRDLEGNVRTAERLRAVKLKNGDEPDFTFIA